MNLEQRHAAAARVMAAVMTSSGEDEVTARLACHDRADLIDGLMYMHGHLEASMRQLAAERRMDPSVFLSAFTAELAAYAAELTSPSENL